MARSLDGLIHHLLDRIALCGEYGALPSDYIAYVRTYYDPPEKAVVANGDEAAAQKLSSVPNVDRYFLEQVWLWLIEHPEIRLGDRTVCKRLTLSDVEAGNAAIEQTPTSELVSQIPQPGGTNIAFQGPVSVANVHDGLASQQSESTEVADTAARAETAIEIAQDSVTASAADQDGQNTRKDEATARPTASEKPAMDIGTSSHNTRIRLYASVNRMWHALTGHGPDLNKVRVLDFACLSLIAASGPKGIYQNDLVRKSGQDKRSLPTRTERLYKDGYIQKERVCVQLLNAKRLMHTSHLMLKRFATETPYQEAHPERTKDRGAPVEKETGETQDLDENQEVELSATTALRRGEISKLERPVPQWTPDRSPCNQIFDLIDRSGTQGMNMNDIRDTLFGEYVRRPATEYVTRLTECWQMSQPLHLRHLSIIRDTILKGKGSIFNYYTYESFNKLVEKGVGFWEAVVTVPDDLTAGRNFAASLDEVPDLDDFGFPVIDSNLFHGPNNSATLDECASLLKEDTFNISSSGPVLQRQANGIYDVHSSHPNAASNKLKAPTRNMIFSLAKPPNADRSIQMAVGVKRRGRPRKYPAAGASIDIDQLDTHTIQRQNRSQEMAEKYARGKIEKKISLRIAGGGDAVLVTSCVLDQTESLRKEAGQESLSEYTKGMIIHTFAGGPAPPPLRHKRSLRGQPKIAPYRPSMAAHTMFVPAPGGRILLGSSGPLKPGRKADKNSNKIRRVAAHLLEQEIEADVLPTENNRQRKADTEDTAVTPYWPSSAAHTWSHTLPPLLSEKTSEEKVKPRQGRPRKELDHIGPRPRRKQPSDLRFCYLPSILAHSAAFLPPLSLPIVQCPKRKSISKAPVQHGSANLTPVSIPYGIQFEFFPSTAAHSSSFLPMYIPPPVQAPKAKKAGKVALQPDEVPATPENEISAPRTPLITPIRELSQAPLGLHAGPYPEGFYPGWVKFMFRYYESDLKNIVRTHDGIYLGKTTRRRKRNTEPVGFRPQSFKVVVFRSARLREMPWFIEKAEAPQQAPASLAKGQSLMHSENPAPSRLGLEQSEVPPAGKPSPQTLMLIPRVLHDQSPVPPACGPSPQPRRLSPCYSQETSVLPSARGALPSLGKPVDGSIVSTSPYSQLSSDKELDSYPPLVHTSPYPVKTGQKRKHDESHQPHRGQPSLNHFSMDLHGGSGCSAQTIQSPESRAPHVVQKDSPTLEKIDPRNIDNANSVIDEAPSHGIGKTSIEVERMPSGIEWKYTTATKASSPITEDTIMASASVPLTVERILPLELGKEVYPIVEMTQSAESSSRPVAEELPAITGAVPLIIDGTGKQTSDPHDRTTILLGWAGTTQPPPVRTTTPPFPDEDEIVDKNMTAAIQTPRTYESSQHDGGPTLPQTSRPTEIPLTPHLSTLDTGSSIGSGKSPTKSPKPLLTTVNSVLPGIDEAHYLSLKASSLQSPRPPVTPVTKPKPVTRRKLFGKLNRQGGSVAMLRKMVILEIIDKCGGVYPGHKELIKAFVIEWERKGLEGGTPEDKTMQNSVDALCSEGKLQQIIFFFKDQKGLKVKKDMLMYPSIDVMDPRVKDVQRRMIAHHPRFFWPSAVVPPDEYSAKTQKMMDGKERVQDARYTALKAKEQLAQRENSGQNGTEGASAQSARLESDQILEVPHIPQISPSRARRPDGSRPRRNGRERRMGDLTSLRKFTTMEASSLAATAQPPLPRPASTPANNSRDLLWLPEQYAFSEFNYEEERPTVLEPTINDHRHRPHARYGMQMDPPKRIRRLAPINPANNWTKLPGAPIVQDRATAKGRRPSLLYSHIRPSYPSSPLASMQTSSLFSGLQSKNSYPRPAASHLEYSPYNSPYTAGASEEDLASSMAAVGHKQPTLKRRPVLSAPDTFRSEDLGQSLKTQSQSPDPSAIGSVFTWLPIEQTHNFRPRPNELVVNFMDALHYFHQSSGTFSVGFSGFAPPRQINKDVGTCSKPYSYGSRTIHRDFPAQRGPRSLLPKRSLEAEDTRFEREVDNQLRWELESKGLEHARFGHLTFINHSFSHDHTTVEAVDANMDQLKGFVISSDNGRITNRRLVNVNTIRSRISDRIPNPGTREVSAEAWKRSEVRTPLKRRRLTSFVEGTPQEDSSKIVPLDANGRPAKLRRIRGPREARLLRRDDERRLLIAVMVVRTLTGGLEERVDWVIVSKVFDCTYEQNFIATRWPYIRNKFKLVLPKMEADFQEMFAKAYEEGSVPVLDFDNLEDYDWKWLTEWTLEHLGTSSQSQPDLPAKRAELNDLYKFKEPSEIDINDYYDINGAAKHTVAKRESILTSSSYVYPIKGEGPKNPFQGRDQYAIAKTWVRANFITSASTYKPDNASVKLGTFPDHVVDDALRQLVSDQVLSQENKGRLIPGRNYHISDHLISRLGKKLLPIHFQRAVESKQRVDKDFAEKGLVLFPYTADDGDTLAMINLLAHKRIKLVPINLPLNEWGQVDGGYETRLMDKNRLNFQVEMHPLPSYVGGNPLESIPPPPSQHLQDPIAKIPLWYGINGELVSVMWDMALAAVMAVLAVRPGVNAEEIEKATRPAMYAWEIEIIFGWLEEAKAAIRVGSGYALGQWWWLTLPAGGEAGIEPLSAHGQLAETDGPSNGNTSDKGKGK